MVIERESLSVTIPGQVCSKVLNNLLQSYVCFHLSWIQFHFQGQKTSVWSGTSGQKSDVAEGIFACPH